MNCMIPRRAAPRDLCPRVRWSGSRTAARSSGPGHLDARHEAAEEQVLVAQDRGQPAKYST